MGFDLSKAAYGKASVSNLDKIQRIPLSDILTNEKNFYSVDNVDVLADSIKMVGLMDPVRVLMADGKYRLISGHRRFAAYQLLAEESEEYGRIPALVVGSMDDLTETVALITANSTARELTYAEKLQQEQLLRETLLAMKAAGKAIPRNLSQYIADQIGVSRNEVSRMHSVNENLIPEARAEVDAGNMTAQKAYDLSRKPKSEQQAELAPQGKKVEEQANSAEDQQFCACVIIMAQHGHFDFLLDTPPAGRKDGIQQLKTQFGSFGHWGDDCCFDGSSRGLTVYPEKRITHDITRSWTEVWDSLCLWAIKKAMEGNHESK